MMAMAPIYGTNGNFLGTDDQGLKGTPIVMKEENFKQGMSHKEALSYSEGIEGFESQEALQTYANTQANLKNRPDYDGFVTINEGVQWAKDHPNSTNSDNPLDALYLDSSKLDFGNLKSSDLVEGVKGNVNLFDYVDYTSSKSRFTTYALGNTQIELINKSNGTVKLFSDVYDWDYHDKNYKHDSSNPPSSKRDKLVWGDREIKGLNDTHGFKVFMYGTGTLRK